MFYESKTCIPENINFNKFLIWFSFVIFIPYAPIAPKANRLPQN
jgi:hypothetical protein